MSSRLLNNLSKGQQTIKMFPARSITHAFRSSRFLRTGLPHESLWSKKNWHERIWLNRNASVGSTHSIDEDGGAESRIDSAKEKVSHLLKSTSFIGGEFVNERADKTFDVIYPFNGQVVQTLHQASVDDVRIAVSTAADALPEWQAASVSTRCAMVKRLASLMRDEREALSLLITLESAKPISQARAEVEYAASLFDWCSQPVLTTQGTQVLSHGAKSMSTVSLHPVGIVLALVPWNLPLAMLARKMAGALTAGCAVVTKPSERTPLSALAFAEISKRAGIPAGVTNIVASEDGEEVVQASLETKMIRKVSFTGSTKVGRQVGAAAVMNGARPLLELGGNAPVIVHDDADISQAVQCVMANKIRMSGQTCIAANRIYVHSSVHDTFVEQLTTAVKKLTVGCGLISGTERSDLGAVIDEAAALRIESTVRSATECGATLVTGGSASGAIMSPTVLTGVTDDMEVCRGEIFGPVWSILHYDDVNDVLKRANNTGAGLAGYVFSKRTDVVRKLCDGLQFGLIGVNEMAVGRADVPFGGGKDSGMGREGGPDAVRAYMEEKLSVISV